MIHLTNSNNMKKYLSFAAFAICAICAFTFISCGEEDDTPTPKTEDKQQTGGQDTPTPTNVLVGKWTKSSTETGAGNEIYGKITVTITESYEFKSDMTFESLGSYVTSYEKIQTPAEQRSRTTGTYTYKDNVLALTYIWSGFWDWEANDWHQQGDLQPYTTEYIVTIKDKAVTIAPKNNPDESKTYTYGEGGNSGDLATQILGSWYLTEVSADKLLVNVIVFNANGQGTFSEIKAKAKNNWAVTEESAPFTYTLSGNRVTMVFVQDGPSETRVGDIVMNGDGSASVTHDADGGQSTVTQQMLRLNGKTGREIMDELLNNQNGSGDNNLIGTWEATGEQVKNVFTFTNDKLTHSEYFLKDGSWTLVRENGWESSYSLENGILSYNEESFTTKLLYNNTALAILGPGYVQHILYKQGATISATLQDIQGDWRWYMDGDVQNTRVAVQIKNNQMTLIIVPWGQRYDGTITYANGYIHFEVTSAYTSREEGTGEGWGEGELNPVTLEANWKPLDSGSWMYFDTQGMPFVADGDVAYGILANLPGIYHKIK